MVTARRTRFLPLWLEIPLFASTFFLPFLWIPAGYIVNGNDTSFPSHPWQFAYNRLFTWNPVSNGGADYGHAMGSAIWYVVQGVFTSLGFDNTNVERLSFGFWICLTTLAMLFCLRILTRRPVATYVGTLLYALNPFVFSGAMWENASLANVALYYSLPSLIGLFVLIQSGRVSMRVGLALFGVAAFLASPIGIGPPMQIAFIVAAAIFLGFQLVSPLRRVRRVAFLTRTVAVVSVCVMVWLYWILPLFKYVTDIVRQAGGASLSALALQSWLVPISKHTSLVNVARLIGAWDWFEVFNGNPLIANGPMYTKGALMILAGILIAILSYACLVLTRGRRMRRLAVLGALFGVIGSLLAAGAHPPTGAIYLLLYHYVPGMQVERSPWYMFETLTVFGYAIMFGLTLDALETRWPRWRASIRGAGVVLVVAYAWPMFTMSFFEPFRPGLPGFLVSYPRYVVRAVRYLDRQPGRYLSLPFEGGSAFYWRGGPFESGTPMTTFLMSRDVAFSYTNTGGTSMDPFEVLLRRCARDILSESSAARGELQALGISDIVVQDDEWYDLNGITAPPSVWRAAVEHIKGIRSAAAFGPWHVYSIPYQGAIQGAPSLAVGTLSASQIGDWSALTRGRIPFVSASAPSYGRTFGSSRALVSDIVRGRDPTGTRVWGFLRRVFPGARRVDVTTGSASPADGRRPRVLAVTAAAARRRRVFPLISLGRWIRAGLSTSRLRALPEMPAFSYSDVAVTWLAATNSAKSLVVTNAGDGYADVSLLLPRDSQPNLRAPLLESWNAEQGLLRLRAPPGRSIEQVIVPGDEAPVKVIESSEEQVPPQPPRRLMLAMKGADLEVMIGPGDARARPSGVVLPLVANVPMDIDPVISADVRVRSSGTARVVVLADLVRPDGASFLVEAPFRNDQVDMEKYLDRRFSREWEIERRLHADDLQWLLAHRVPERASRLLIRRLGLVLERTAGDAASPSLTLTRFVLRSLSVDAVAGYGPVRHVTTLSLDPSVALWSGLSSAAHPDLLTFRGVTILAAQPVTSFTDFEPGTTIHLQRGEHYIVTLVGEQPFDAEVVGLSRKRVSLRGENAETRQILRSAIVSLARPEAGGVVTVRQVLPALPIVGRTLGVSYSVDHRQHVAFELDFEAHRRRYRVRSTPGDATFIRDGGRLIESSSLSLFEPSSALTVSNTGGLYVASTPPGSRALIDLERLAKESGVPPDARLISLRVVVTDASLGFALGRAEIVDDLGIASTRRAGRSRITDVMVESGNERSTGPTPRIHFRQGDPTRYFVIANSASPFVLTLDQNYNDGWAALRDPSAQQGGIHSYWRIALAVLRGDSLLPHFQADGYKNAWIMPAGRDVHVTLVFLPQLILISAGLVSAAALGVCVLILLASGIRHAFPP